ncbi:MAG: ATP cone domain-containing protein, partial [Candidatus Azotimanducaceae bacterium]
MDTTESVSQSQSSTNIEPLTAENQNTILSPSVTSTAPGQLKIIKRNGAVVGYESDKIAVAMTKAFLAVEGGTAAASPRIRELVNQLTDQVCQTFERRLPTGGTLHIEEVQDQVELALMRSGEHQVARSYVLYRAERAKLRTETGQTQPKDDAYSNIHVTNKDGSQEPLDVARLRTLIGEACQDLRGVNADRVIESALDNMYDGISVDDVATSILITARTLVEEEPSYTYVTSRLLLDQLRTEALDFLAVAENATQGQMTELYPKTLGAFIDKGIQLELLDPQLTKFDLTFLGEAIRPERDLQFTYLGLQTLYDRYFIHWDEVRFELPQVFFMRVAMGLATEEDDPNTRAVEFYDLLSSFDYMSSTPTLFKSGTLRPQLSSCFLTTVTD